MTDSRKTLKLTEVSDFFTSCGSDELLVLGAPPSVSGRAPPDQRCNHQEVISQRELKTDFIGAQVRGFGRLHPAGSEHFTTSEHLSWTSLESLLAQVHLSLGLFWTGSDTLNGYPLISARPAPRVRSRSKYLVMSGNVQVSLGSDHSLVHL